MFHRAPLLGILHPIIAHYGFHIVCLCTLCLCIMCLCTVFLWPLRHHHPVKWLDFPVQIGFLLPWTFCIYLVYNMMNMCTVFYSYWMVEKYMGDLAMPENWVKCVIWLISGQLFCFFLQYIVFMDALCWNTIKIVNVMHLRDWDWGKMRQASILRLWHHTFYFWIQAGNCTIPCGNHQVWLSHWPVFVW